MLSKFTVNPYKDFENKIMMVKAPIIEELEEFEKEAIKTKEQNNR